MLVAVDREPNDDCIQKRRTALLGTTPPKVVADAKLEFVAARRHVVTFEQGLVRTTVGIGCRKHQHFTMPANTKQANIHGLGRTTVHGVENMRCQSTH